VHYGLALDRPQRLCQHIGDSAKMAGNRCSNCVAFDSECTHLFMNQVRSYTLSFTTKKSLISRKKNAIRFKWVLRSQRLSTILIFAFRTQDNDSAAKRSRAQLRKLQNVHATPRFDHSIQQPLPPAHKHRPSPGNAHKPSSIRTKARKGTLQSLFLFQL
jgi:hypothetical protein